jgi:hypothetical protein
MKWSWTTPTIVASAALTTLPSFACVDHEDSREFVVTIENHAPRISLYEVGSFPPTELQAPSELLEPGESTSFEIAAGPEARLQLMMMFSQSNDAFLAFEPGGISLWGPDGTIVEGDRTDELVLWDAGTELNEVPGAGAFQAPRQASAGAGVDEHAFITRIVDGHGGGAKGPGGHEFPAIEDFVRLELEDLGDWHLEVKITNVSAEDLLEVPDGEPVPALLSPGIYLVYEEGMQIFSEGEAAFHALEVLAEDGEASLVRGELEDVQGVSSELSSVVWALHGGELELYRVGQRASASLEMLAEDGFALELVRELSLDPTLVEYGLAGPESSWSFGPGEQVELRVRARPGDYLSFAMADLAGNDSFVGAGERGIPMFVDGQPNLGDHVEALQLLDAGTELDEAPGRGPNQAPYQPGLGGGMSEDGFVHELDSSRGDFGHGEPESFVSVRFELAEGEPEAD